MIHIHSYSGPGLQELGATTVFVDP
jgi:hypothetical protein